ncbi:MAG: serine O-acetyltransferase [Clostridia bacterium]|nr:serine O-acetyltransferase [Clostridia bacterium]
MDRLEIIKQITEEENELKFTDTLPDKKELVKFIDKLLNVLYGKDQGVGSAMEMLKDILKDENYEKTYEFFSHIPEVRKSLKLDLVAIYNGDPAAESYEEVVYCYPGFYAITVYRLAHVLYTMGLKVIARALSEHAHSLTGIDINPGAEIGKSFFIDHGTGIVVGETTVIGDNVKLYQSVTLGAISTRGGISLKGKKRHPSIGNNVTIYAGASVLGNVYIGDNCVLGSNTFVTTDLKENTIVTIEPEQKHLSKSDIERRA